MAITGRYLCRPVSRSVIDNDNLERLANPQRGRRGRRHGRANVLPLIVSGDDERELEAP
jgi:hypothetical protein